MFSVKQKVFRNKMISNTESTKLFEKHYIYGNDGSVIALYYVNIKFGPKQNLPEYEYCVSTENTDEKTKKRIFYCISSKETSYIIKIVISKNIEIDIYGQILSYFFENTSIDLENNILNYDNFNLNVIICDCGFHNINMKNCALCSGSLIQTKIDLGRYISSSSSSLNNSKDLLQSRKVSNEIHDALFVENGLILKLSYPETGERKIFTLSKDYDIIDFFNKILINENRIFFVSTGNGFYKELLTDIKYYDMMNKRKQEDNTFRFNSNQIFEFLPFNKDKILKGLYINVHQLKNNDEIIVYSSSLNPLFPPLTISAMEDSYRFNQDMVLSVVKLNQKYSGFQKIRGDGNCYYRAFMVGFIKDLISNVNVDGIIHLINLISDTKCIFIEEHNDFKNLLEFLTNLISNGNFITKEFEEILVNKPIIDEELVWFSRYLVANYLMINKEIIQKNELSVSMNINASFDVTVEQYCKETILKYGTHAESPFIEFGILEQFLECDCTIQLLDRVGNSQQFKYDLKGNKFGSVHILLKTGHYDLLIPK
jgi:hypothetical protein